MTRIEVTFFNHQTISRDVTGIGWKVDTARRVLVIGHGVPRLEIPLDNVLCWEITTDEEAERDEARARLAKVEALHTGPERIWYSHQQYADCCSCGHPKYPCPTREALGGDE